MLLPPTGGGRQVLVRLSPHFSRGKSAPGSRTICRQGTTAGGGLNRDRATRFGELRLFAASAARQSFARPSPGFSLAVTLLLLAALVASPAAAASEPQHLVDTGLYADFATKAIASDVHPFSPQYPLWSDGATKRRWIRLPKGSRIDAHNPDAWVFPVGTRFWKEFAFDRRVETRLIERGKNGEWLFATYRWNEDGSDAVLVPEKGARRVAESRPGVPYDLPGVVECRACHASGLATILGFSALQLSSDRDPNALHAIPPDPGSLDLDELQRRGWIRGLPKALAANPPRVRASSPTERTALGYLHANCSNCHNSQSLIADLGLSFVVRADGTPEALATAVGKPSHYHPTGTTIERTIVPGDPDASLVITRISNRGNARQMPPIDSHLADADAIALLGRWIRDLGAPPTAESDPSNATSSAPPSGKSRGEEP